MFENIVVTYEEPLATVQLNRPERRNALSLATLRELCRAFEDLQTHTEIRCIILASAGTVFSSGHDLNELRGRDLDDYRCTFDLCTHMMEQMQSLPQPVIAQVQGVATAAGCQLVAACDLAVASEQATFATPGVRIGLFCSTPMVALSRAIGRKRALEMLLTGAAIDARTASDWGLINRVVPAAELEQATRALALKCAEASGAILALGKQAFYQQIDSAQADAYSYAKELMATSAVTEDAQEGISAFFEKRPPLWKHRTR